MVTQQPERAQPTLEVVAERAGVSRSTASRVLTGATNVSPAARAAVMRAAAELEYAPNHAARSLVTRRSDTVAFVVSESEERFFADPFFGSLLRGAHSEISRLGRQLVFAVTGGDAERKQLISFAAGGHVDGVVLVSLHDSDPMPRRLRKAGIPVVLAGRPVGHDHDARYVDADNVGGGRMATRLLLDRGCQRIVSISGPLDMPAAQDRLEGLNFELTAARRRPRRKDVVDGDFTAEGGADAMRRLLREVPDLDGVFAASDLMGVAAIQVLQTAGRRVPEDVAVVGFDDLPAGLLSTPQLTTVRQPIEALGRAAARMLVDVVDGIPVARSMVLPTELVRRESA